MLCDPMTNKLVLVLAFVLPYALISTAHSADANAGPVRPTSHGFSQDSSRRSRTFTGISRWTPEARCRPNGFSSAAALGLAWAYGINNPNAHDPGYWRDVCSPEYRRWAGLGKKPSQVTTQLIRPGVALDEWCNPAHRRSEQWAVRGPASGRRRWPDCSIAVWVTDLTKPLAALVRDGTVDLLILECYTHAPASLGPGPFAQSLAWRLSSRGVGEEGRSARQGDHLPRSHHR